MRNGVLFAVTITAAECSAEMPGGASAVARAPAKLRAEVVNQYPHDIWAFTEGLLMHGGTLYESTGAAGFSTLRQVDLPTGQIIQVTRLRRDDFAEGLALKGNRLIQLTWKQGIAYVYRLSDLKRVGILHYRGEGWGLCFDGTRFAMSDGSDYIVFRHPKTFAEIGRVQVTLNGLPVKYLNELECVGGSIYANVWKTDEIVEISASDGVVQAVVDVSNLLSIDERKCLELTGHADQAVLNGIAYDNQTATFLLTGKLWPKLFRVRFVPQ
jgi:glutaminyl-peptide cyclotransferase